MVSTCSDPAGERSACFAGSERVFDPSEHKPQGIWLLSLVPAPETTGLLRQEALAPLGNSSPHLRRQNVMRRGQRRHTCHGVGQEHLLDASAQPLEHLPSQGKVLTGLYGSSSPVCAHERSSHGGVSVPSCAQRVYGGAELGEMLLIRRSPPRFCKEGRRFSTRINPLSMTLTWSEPVER